MKNLYKINVYYNGWSEDWHLGDFWGEYLSNRRQTMFEYSKEALKRNIEFSPNCLLLQSQAFTDFLTFQFQLPGEKYKI